MKFLNLNKVLCLSSHPDDTEYGMLGSMMKFEETTFDVLVLSNGGDFDKTTGESRQKECMAIWDRVQFNVNGRFFPKTHVKDTPEDEWVNLIEQKYNISTRISGPVALAAEWLATLNRGFAPLSPWINLLQDG